MAAAVAFAPAAAAIVAGAVALVAAAAVVAAVIAKAHQRIPPKHFVLQQGRQL